MWLEISIIAFLGASLMLYCLFAGADFGAGILEAFRGESLRREQREVIAHAISPVWEANHVWLILAIVILFVGFPKTYAAMSVAFHIPLTVMLLGIVLRGCAFTFRQYDAVKDPGSQRLYSAIFVISSFLTPMMLGCVAAGLFYVGVKAPADGGFYSLYVAPWANLFALALGLFTCVLFTFLASVYLVGETTKPALRHLFVQRAYFANGLTVLTGGMVFAAARMDGLPLVEMFKDQPSCALCMVLTTLLLIPLWASLRLGHVWRARVFAALQVSLILIGWFGLPPMMSLLARPAPEQTLLFLLGALIGGSLFIFPSLYYLFRVFK